MKKLLLSAAALCCFVSAHAQWVNTSGNPTTSTSEAITRNGNVAIGVSAPSVRFHVRGNATNGSPFVYFDDGFMGDRYSFLTDGGLGAEFRMNSGASRVRSTGTLSFLGDAVNGAPFIYLNDGVLADRYAFISDKGSGAEFRMNSSVARIHSTGNLGFHVNTGRAVLIEANGNVVVGTPAPTGTQGVYKLNVWGRARANEIVVNTTGADFVFAKDYRLRPLGEVEQFIAINQHLPEIPSAQEMQQNGMAVGELQTKLLQKVEELTLYVIEQNKKLEAQQKEAVAQAGKIAELEQQLAAGKK